MVENNERVERQQNLPIEVIIGNPPWSAWQRSASDDNPNVEYPQLEERIKETYASRVNTTLKNSLYDTYKMAIRWASDRIQEKGIIAFVTPASWIDGSVDAGIRASLKDEFSSVYVLSLLGNARIYGERGKLEGEGVFGNATQSPVAITLLVKESDVKSNECSIHYRDIGSDLKREEKLTKLSDAKSIQGFRDWQIIIPNEYHDWIEQRSETFSLLYPLGTKEAKSGRADDAIFKLFSTGYKTGRDAFIYNFSGDACAQNAKKMTHDYLTALSELEANRDLTVDEVTTQHNKNIKWDRELNNNLRRMKETEFEDNYIRKVLYRPFIATNCYADYTFAQVKGQTDRIFPNCSSENRVICVPNKGSKNPFSALMTDTMPDMHFIEAAQCFPRWQYPKPANARQITSGYEQERIDNISDTALRAFRKHYCDDSIIKDDIFDYIYGILHAPTYREQFANDLSKMLPRIPYAPDFRAFAAAGKALAELHLNYETCERFQGLSVQPIKMELLWEEKPEHFLLGTKSMKYKDKNKKDVLIINEHVQIEGIPEEAHGYVVNGRTPLEWFINRYKIVPSEKNNGILNDANCWFENPRDLITAIERIVYVSVESTKIIDGLPSEITDS